MTKRRRKILLDSAGRPTWVVLPIEEYDELMETAEQREDIRHLEKGKRIKGKDKPWEQVKLNLRAKSKLS